MYSYGERLRAVKLYIKFGKRVQAMIGELGYPMKTTLVAGQPKACRALERFEGAAHEANARTDDEEYETHTRKISL